MVSRCQATNASGSPCSAQPVRADGHCFWHSPAIAAERDAARRRGGSARSNQARARKQLPDGLLTNQELQGLIGKTIADVRAGTIEPGVARSVFDGARTYVAVAEAGAVETLQNQVDELRALIARRGSA